jgi:hypothetical protein
MVGTSAAQRRADAYADTAECESCYTRAEHIEIQGGVTLLLSTL